MMMSRRAIPLRYASGASKHSRLCVACVSEMRALVVICLMTGEKPSSREVIVTSPLPHCVILHRNSLMNPFLSDLILYAHIEWSISR